ncbi:hypothetical protein QBC41DRAFT_313481 [Cercophora samala]|uniref:Uncharacterized protein n=1 Tax=Cercophora samala TaxID=330535 RepID=A0AA39ZK85_9PEZI|nr:hypothetical protein QBC41DRAFT_313481 [Cercophora samala]
MARPHLLLIPGELRNYIYKDYLGAGHEGVNEYIYDYEANKLRTADNRPIDLNLMYTCKVIAQEMHGLPLRLFTVSFSTLFSDSLRTRAARWAYFNAQFDNRTGWPSVCEALDRETVRQVVGEQSILLHTWYVGQDDARLHDYPAFDPAGWDQVPSVQRSLRAQLIQKVIAQGTGTTGWDPSQGSSGEEWNSRRNENEPDEEWDTRGGLAAFLDFVGEPWRIPTEDELDAIGARLPTRKLHMAAMTRDMWQSHPGRFRFSAAAAAIHFLGSLPVSTRKLITKIRLQEDQISVAFPECHIRGLVPYCQENPALRIERCASLWVNLFQIPYWDCVSCQYQSNDFFIHDGEFGVVNFDLNFGGWYDSKDALCVRFASAPVAAWMAEAAHPEVPNTISLVLDGDPTPERSADVFRDAFQVDAAWQIALERRWKKPHDLYRTRIYDSFEGWGWKAVNFPQLLRDLNKPSSRIRCNFDPGQPWDDERIEELIRNREREEGDSVNSQYYAWSEGGDKERFFYAHTFYETASPLPTFFELLGVNMKVRQDETEWIPPWEPRDDQS